MLDVTDEALEALRDLIVESEPAGCALPELAFRLKPARGGSLGLAFDAPRPDDQVLSLEGRNVVLLDSVTASTFSGFTLDVRRGSQGPNLVLRFSGAPAGSPRGTRAEPDEPLRMGA